jgi:hypothetical protein
MLEKFVLQNLHESSRQAAGFLSQIFTSHLTCRLVTFDVSLTVHLSTTLANDQPDAQIFLNTFIVIIYMYMFRVISCSYLGGQIVFIQHLVSSQSDDTRCCINLLKPTGYVMHHHFKFQQLYALPTLCLCVLYLSHNKQRLVPLTA